MIISLVISAAIFPITIALTETCDFMNDIIANQDSLKA